MSRFVTLRDVCQSVDYGLTASAIPGRTGPRFLRITDIDGSFVEWEGVPRCAATDSEVAKYALRTGDIVVARTGASTGRSQWVEVPGPAVFASYLVRFRARVDVCSRFLGYVFSSRAWSEHVASVAHGKSAQPNMSASEMARFQFDCPELAEQRAIAEVLGSLDDKIAANNNLVHTTELLANTRFLQVARGVELSDRIFADIADVGGGGTPGTKVDKYWGGEICWATPTDVTALTGPYLESTARRISQAGLEACASTLYPAGSILMTSRATIGAFTVAQRPMAVNQGFIVVNPHDPSLRWWVFHEMQRRVDEFLSHANGATFLELSRTNFKRLQVHLADEPVMKAFGDEVEALHARARAALIESKILATTRDTLLPELMSGRLRVKDAERVVEGVV